MTEGPMI